MQTYIIFKNITLSFKKFHFMSVSYSTCLIERNSVEIQIQSHGSSDSISLKNTVLQATAEATPIHKGFVVKKKSGARSGFLRVPRFPPVVILPTAPSYMFIFQ